MLLWLTSDMLNIGDITQYVYYIYFPMETGSWEWSAVHLMIIVWMDVNMIVSFASASRESLSHNDEE